MTTVYLVTSGDGEDGSEWRLWGVFTSRELAEVGRAEVIADGHSVNEVEEWRPIHPSSINQTIPTKQRTTMIEHIGDGVYAEYDHGTIQLRVNDHRNPVAVVLEPEVMDSLIAFYKRVTTGASQSSDISESSVIPTVNRDSDIGL